MTQQHTQHTTRRLFDIIQDLLAAIEQSDGEITDAVDSIEVELEAKCEAYRAIMLRLESEEAANADLAKHYSARAATRKRQSEALKNRLLDAMLATNTPKIATPTCTAYTQQSTSVEVDVDFCEHAADRFVRVTTAPDKKAIAEALKEGAHVEGAKLVHSTSLRFR